MKILGQYKNGNANVIIFDTGTKVRIIEGIEVYNPKFAENIDVKITDHCDMGCEFCHEGSSTSGHHGNLNARFFNTLHPYQELAIGGGNILDHPDLYEFLKRMKEKKVIVNVTLNQRHFERGIDLVDKLVRENLINGLGVSLVEPTESFINTLKYYPNAVLHVINGIFSSSDYEKLANHDLKILILGYKRIRRGTLYQANHERDVLKNQRWLKEFLPKLVDGFSVVSFDNLAIEQLGILERMSCSDIDKFYMGDDGTATFYIDAVKGEFAKSSVTLFNDRKRVLNSVDKMFKMVRNEMA